MEIRRMGQTLLGSCLYQSPLLNFLAPCIPHLFSSATRSHSHLVFALPVSQRPHTTYRTIRRVSSSSNSNPADILDAEKSNDATRTRRFTPAAPAKSNFEKPEAKVDSIDNFLSNPSLNDASSPSLGFPDVENGNDAPRNRRFIPATPPPSNDESPKSSAERIDDYLSETLSTNPFPPKRRRVFPTKPSSLAAVKQAYEKWTKQGDIASGMLMPPGSANTSVSASNMLADALRGTLKERHVEPRAQRTIKSNPSLSRTVEISSKADLGAGFERLRFFVRDNQIRHDQQMQRFYERPGMRRKRLRRERWRARFKENFHNAVEKIKAMRRMGW